MLIFIYCSFPKSIKYLPRINLFVIGSNLLAAFHYICANNIAFILAFNANNKNEAI